MAMNVLKLMFSRKMGWKLIIALISLFTFIVVYFESPIQYVMKRVIPNTAIYYKISKQQEQGGCRENYSIPEVNIFIEDYQRRTQLIDTFFHIDHKESYTTFLAKLKARRKTGKLMKDFIQNNNTWAWEVFHQKINQYFLYDPDDPTYYEQLLKDLNQRPIVHTDINSRSSHLVLIVTFDNGGKGVYKFMRTPRNHEVLQNHFFFSDIERPHAEIASFHLDKVLGLNRVPPTVGRVLNITRDIAEVGVQVLTKTLHKSPVGNLCFYGKCQDYCKIDFSICGTPDTIEGAMSVFLPNRTYNSWYYSEQSPWMRRYNPILKAKWELYEDYCETDVKTRESFKGRKILDFSDLGVFDFLIGNLDRHHVEQFRQFENDTYILHLDNGRGFGKSHYDCMSCMAPLRQCCLIRLSTLSKLVKLYIGPDSLSHVLRESLKVDPIAPVLWEPHLDALDRRVGKILKVVSDCIKVKGKQWHEVVKNDGFY